jgi:Fe-S-cluster-containing hydrogenase component 2
MSVRQIIEINESKCNGCGLCANGCPEGALQIIDGKARLVGEVLCDGLGACIGTCPEGAITITEREAEDYEEKKVINNIIPHGRNTIIAHLKHLIAHNQVEFVKQAKEVLKEKNIIISVEELTGENEEHGSGCPGSKAMAFNKQNKLKDNDAGVRQSELSHWPIQLHLVSPTAQYYKNQDVVLTADCVGYSLGDFHKDYMKNKSIAIACPKLDRDREIYIEKITSMIDDAKINTLTVMIMEVPCCGGLLQIAKEALNKATKKVPVKVIVVGIKGEIIKDEWI